MSHVFSGKPTNVDGSKDYHQEIKGVKPVRKSPCQTEQETRSMISEKQEYSEAVRVMFQWKKWQH